MQVLMAVAVGALTCACLWNLLALATARDAARGHRAVRRRPVRKKDTAAAVTLGQISEMVDVIRLGLLAGLSFDAALGLYCENQRGPLSAHMAQARLAWQVGMGSREENLTAVARKVRVRQLESFASAVGQAHAMGAPLSDTLARQGKEIRAAHRAAVEREIERAPVKLLIPTGVLILPALLLSIIGPLAAASGIV